MRKDYLAIGLLGLWLLSFFVAATLFFFTHGGRTERVLFFPEYDKARVRGEARILPKKENREDDILLLTRELVLGPFEVHYDRVFPKSTDVESVLLRDGSLYIDFSLDPILRNEGSVLSFEEKIGVLKRTIRFNFPSVESIRVSFKGESPELGELR